MNDELRKKSALDQLISAGLVGEFNRHTKIFQIIGGSNREVIRFEEGDSSTIYEDSFRITGDSLDDCYVTEAMNDDMKFKGVLEDCIGWIIKSKNKLSV